MTLPAALAATGGLTELLSRGAAARATPHAATAGRTITGATARSAAGGATTQGAPYAVVLGTAQDAGVPQVNCFNPNCVAVRTGQRPAPRVASLGIVDPRGDSGGDREVDPVVDSALDSRGDREVDRAGGRAGAQARDAAGNQTNAPAGGSARAPHRRFIIDATPDFVAQVGELLTHPEGTSTLDGSVPLTDYLHGILLTHAHMGHYTGLVHLGREAAAAGELPLFASASMAKYLSGNEPWASLVRNGNVRIHELQPGVRLRLSPRLEITPFAVLHRQELSDTLGFLVHGPDRTLMYVPDADRWDGWPRDGMRGNAGTEPFDFWLGHADVALLDGSFYSHDELGHRPQGEVPHPPVVVSMERLAARLDDLEVAFTHLNNTNPLWNTDGPERETVRRRGFSVAQRGRLLHL